MCVGQPLVGLSDLDHNNTFYHNSMQTGQSLGKTGKLDDIRVKQKKRRGFEHSFKHLNDFQLLLISHPG